MRFAYPPKIIVAWAEAIGGNKKIRDWLLKYDYKELGVFVFALWNKDDARDWLMKNGFPHLLALIRGAEGDEEAVRWLEKNNFGVLAKVALVGDGNEQAYRWLMDQSHRDMAYIGKKIEFIKDWIQRDNDDVHKISWE